MSSHTERRHLRYTPTQLFDLVADVEKYPDFLTGLTAVRVLRREGDTLWIDMTVGLPVFNGHFTSKAVLDRPNRIDITSDSRLFGEYRQSWAFRNAEDGGTLVEFNTRFAFRSPMLRLAARLLFGGVEQSMVDAFRQRARLVYGAGQQPWPESARAGERKSD